MAGGPQGRLSPVEMMPPLYPVILSVPAEVKATPAQEKVRLLSLIARDAVRRSAEKSELSIPDFLKDDRGAPIPSRGVFWSLSHKPDYVAGVVSVRPIGIDVEAIQERTAALFRKIAGEEERRLLEDNEDGSFAFHRCWTAKEAVLKAAGVGLRKLSRCTILSVPSNDTTRIRLDGQNWTVAHLRFDNHLAAVVVEGMKVFWEVGAAAGTV